MTGLYVHVPFCRRKCLYCDFASLAGRDELMAPYLDALEKEARRDAPFFNRPETLYIGGGTPGLLSPAHLKKLLSTIESYFGPVKAFKESTFEANPESLSAEKAGILKSSGIGRISLGLQASQDRLLARLGRIASFRDFLEAFGTLRRAGFGDINVDLMTGLPEQSLDDFEETLRAAVSLGPEHISLYPLEIHPGTPLAAEGLRDSGETAAAMFFRALPLLEKAGFRHYEISNFAAPGRESLHNLNYWDQGDYLGLGAAAASHQAGRRWCNTRGVDLYIATAASADGPALEYSEELSCEAREAERIMLGLRRTDGIELTKDIFVKFSARISGLSARGMLEVSGLRLRIKPEAMYTSNEVFREFV